MVKKKNSHRIKNDKRRIPRKKEQENKMIFKQKTFNIIRPFLIVTSININFYHKKYKSVKTL